MRLSRNGEFLIPRGTDVQAYADERPAGEDDMTAEHDVHDVGILVVLVARHVDSASPGRNCWKLGETGAVLSHCKTPGYKKSSIQEWLTI